MKLARIPHLTVGAAAIQVAPIRLRTATQWLVTLLAAFALYGETSAATVEQAQAQCREQFVPVVRECVRKKVVESGGSPVQYIPGCRAAVLPQARSCFARLIGAAGPRANAPSAPAALADSGFAALEAQQSAANAKPGPRTVPGRSIPVPDTVSPQSQAAIAAPYRTPAWNANPKNPAEWKALIKTLADGGAPTRKEVREKLGVTIEPAVIGGVKAFILTPKEIPPANRNRLIVHVHGGGYVYNPGEAGTSEGTLMAAYGGYKVISIDYRMPPDDPYPAAIDDAMAVWREAVKMADPRNIAIVGTSTGGGMLLAMVLRAKQENLPLPGAIAPGTPWSDLTETGDTYKTNEWLDNVLVSYSGYLGHAATLYANGHDLKDPLLSPIYDDFHGFPPAILTSGTRDLFLSLTVLTHRKLRQAGVEAELQVYEGMSHAQYIFDAFAPETKEVFTEIAQFFDKHLGK